MQPTYHDMKRYPHAARFLGLLLRWDAPFFFASAELFQQRVIDRIELRFAEMKGPVRDKFRRFKLTTIFPGKCFHPTIGSAVDAWLKVER